MRSASSICHTALPAQSQRFRSTEAASTLSVLCRHACLFLAVLDDAVAAHVERDGVDARIRVLQAGRVDAVFDAGLHEGA